METDNFDVAKELLHQDCTYTICLEVLIDPEKTCKSYEQNMLEGRRKLDVLEWGKSSMESI